MNLLLIGFSDKAGTAFSMFCSRNMPDIKCHTIERQFNSQFTLMLPRLTSASYQADALIIDLEGVGMPSYDSSHELPLSQFIRDIPVVLISRRNLEEWQAADFLPEATTLYLAAPYSIASAKMILTKLSEIVTKRPTEPTQLEPKDNNSLYNNRSDRARTEVNSTRQEASHIKTSKVNASSSNAKYNKAVNATAAPRHTSSAISKNSVATHLDPILKQYFNSLYDTALVKNILMILAQSQPFTIGFGRRELLINPAEQSVISDIGSRRIVDYFTIVGRHEQTAVNTPQLSLLSEDEYYDRLQQLYDKGAKKQALTTLLWQIADEVIRQDEPSGQHNLALKVNYIPNFSAMRQVPSYVNSVMSACLSKPRRIDELQELFPQLRYQHLNRIFILSILSGVSDISVLQSSAAIDATTQTEHSAIEQETSTNNKDIKKANRTGFFKRLLSKLAI